MRFVMIFNYTTFAWRIYKQDRYSWQAVLDSNGRGNHHRLPFMPAVCQESGDFEDTADSLEEFCNKHIDKFL